MKWIIFTNNSNIHKITTTNISQKIQNKYTKLPLKIKNAKVRKCIYVLLGVKREYMENIFSIIDRDYGSTEKFLSERFGIDEAKINELRKNYLE